MHRAPKSVRPTRPPNPEHRGQGKIGAPSGNLSGRGSRCTAHLKVYAPPDPRTPSTEARVKSAPHRETQADAVARPRRKSLHVPNEESLYGPNEESLHGLNEESLHDRTAAGGRRQSRQGARAARHRRRPPKPRRQRKGAKGRGGARRARARRTPERRGARRG